VNVICSKNLIIVVWCIELGGDFMLKQEILTNLNLGDRVAENEKDSLNEYFVETIEWSRLIRDEIDIIKGSKGSGKSAIYVNIDNRKKEFLKNGIIVCEAENPTGTSAFSKIFENPDITIDKLRDIWKLYLISLIYNSVGRAIGTVGRLFNKRYRQLHRDLISARIIPIGYGLNAIFNKAYDSIINAEVVTTENGVSYDPLSGVPTFYRKIEKRNAGVDIKQRAISLDSIINDMSKILDGSKKKIWIVFDRLDVLLESNKALEILALKALFRMYSDIRMLKNVKMKIFIRDDIWKKITIDGYIEASHLTKETTIEWNKNRLLNLIISRFISNKVICENYGVSKAEIDVSFDKQERLFYRIFPERVDTGTNKSKTFDWIINRITDGLGNCTPRETIHFIQELRNEQMQQISRGEDKSESDCLFARNIFQDAFNKVSKEKMEKVLFAEYPLLRPYIEAFSGLHAEYTKDKIIELLKPISGSEDTIEELSRIGFIAFSKTSGTFKIARLYHPCLEIRLGKED